MSSQSAVTAIARRTNAAAVLQKSAAGKATRIHGIRRSALRRPIKKRRYKKTHQRPSYRPCQGRRENSAINWPQANRRLLPRRPGQFLVSREAQIRIRFTMRQQIRNQSGRMRYQGWDAAQRPASRNFPSVGYDRTLRARLHAHANGAVLAPPLDSCQHSSAKLCVLVPESRPRVRAIHSLLNRQRPLTHLTPPLPRA
jgi:hypothetical protein